MNNTQIIPYNCDSCGTPVLDHNWVVPKPVPEANPLFDRFFYVCDTCFDN